MEVVSGRKEESNFYVFLRIFFLLYNENIVTKFYVFI